MQIVVRVDSEFWREDGMARCEANRVDYLLGLAGTALASARCDTQRLKPLKIGAKLLAPPRPRRADARRVLLRAPRIAQAVRSIDNARVLCKGCNGSKSDRDYPRHGVGLAFRVPRQIMTWGERRAETLDFGEMVQMAKRRRRYRLRG